MKRYKNKYEEELARQAEERTRTEEARKQADREAKERRASRSAVRDASGLDPSLLVNAGSTRGLSMEEQHKLSAANWRREIDDRFPVTGAHKYELVFNNALERMMDLYTEDNAKYQDLLDWASKNVAEGFSIEKISSSVEGTLEKWETDKTWKMPAALRTVQAPSRKS